MKVRRIFCEWLASIVRVKKRTPIGLHDDVEKNDQQDCMEDRFINRVEPPPARPNAVSDPVLIQIRDLLQTKAQRDEMDRVRMKKEAKIRREWMLVARVFDRLCLIFFTTTLVAVNLFFFLIFRFHNDNKVPNLQ